ncbi:hypothetical protein MKJ01_05695 [Chryseobacterium sp. SSA4.19]|uniref:hypothetical protein n=1 Tax=Chryseobacterium sp. SSA4.19 TaxID=2919915 RepID=UPI001F4D94E9|nr:hypothetical protein [Chryseobacterium sp. SSA4.19]MCJ8153254.1 hypothetical protein [Chryseobacterium sp. SSA4.19]
MGRVLNIPGRWIPASDIVVGVLIADHRYGAEASVSVSNDAYQDASMFWGEMLFFKNNLKATTFINGDEAIWRAKTVDFEKTGKIQHSLYLMTDKWANPITGVYEVIPDYYSSTWTALGAAVFTGAVAGQPKPTGLDGNGQTITVTRYPNHGQQMYDVSGGSYGYNVANNTIGHSNLSEFNQMLNVTRNPVELAIGRKLITLAYRNGISNSWTIAKNNFLGGRNSGGRTSGAALTSYGFKQSDKSVKLGEFFYSDAQIAANPNLGWTYTHHLNRQSTVQYEASLTAGGAGSDNYLTAHNNFKAYLTTLINGNGSSIKSLFTSSGWYQEFSHWANMKNGTGWTGTKGDIRALYEDYLSHLSSLLNDHFVFKGGYDEIVGYHTNRDSVLRVDLYSISGGLKINLRRNRLPIDDLIICPITVIIDFTGTSFEGKNFKPSKNCIGIRKISTNVYAIDLTDNCEILEDSTGVYYDFTKPTATAVLSGNNLTITSNIMTKTVVYTVDGNGIVSEVSRDNEFVTSRHLTLSNTTNLKVGFVSAVGESILIEL